MPDHDLKRLIGFFERHAEVFDPSTGNVLKKRGRTRGRGQYLAAALPFIADARNGSTYATWPVWSGSTTKKARFMKPPTSP
jgi:hypothetical protein